MRASIKAAPNKLEACKRLYEFLTKSPTDSAEDISDLIPLLPLILSESVYSYDQVFNRCFGVNSPLFPLINKVTVKFYLPLSLLPSSLRSARLWRPLPYDEERRALILSAKEHFLLSLVIVRVLSVQNLVWPHSAPLGSVFTPAGGFPGLVPPSDLCQYDRILKEHMEFSSQNFRLMLDWIVTAWLNEENEVYGIFSRPGMFDSVRIVSEIVLKHLGNVRGFFGHLICSIGRLISEEQRLMNTEMMVGHLRLWRVLFAKLTKFQNELLDVFVTSMSRMENFEISASLADAVVETYECLVTVGSREVAREIVKETEKVFAVLAGFEGVRARVDRLADLVVVTRPKAALPLLRDVEVKLEGAAAGLPKSAWHLPATRAEFRLILPTLLALAKMIDFVLGRSTIARADAVTQWPRVLAQWWVLAGLGLSVFLVFEDVRLRGIAMITGIFCFVEWTLA
jgi:hypothetical protein